MDSRLSTKDKILELLKKEKSMTVSQLSKRLGITEMAVRKHLNMLERDSLLTVSEVKQPMGRPLQVFALSPKADELFPKNYENMTVEFLHDLKELHGEEIIDYLLEKRSERQKNSYLPNMQGKTAAEKVEKLTEIQNGKGYMANVTKIDEDTYEIVEHNCPIFAVAKEFKKACACETGMFKKVLGADQVERMTCRADNGDHCRFFVKFNQKKKLNV